MKLRVLYEVKLKEISHDVMAKKIKEYINSIDGVCDGKIRSGDDKQNGAYIQNVSNNGIYGGVFTNYNFIDEEINNILDFVGRRGWILTYFTRFNRMVYQDQIADLWTFLVSPNYGNQIIPHNDLFHVSPIVNRNKILKHGLKPFAVRPNTKRIPGRDFHPVYPSRVYLSRDSNNAVMNALGKVFGYGKMDIFRICLNKLPANIKFWVDPEDIDGSDIWTSTHIPANAIVFETTITGENQEQLRNSSDLLYHAKMELNK